MCIHTLEVVSNRPLGSRFGAHDTPSPGIYISPRPTLQFHGQNAFFISVSGLKPHYNTYRFKSWPIGNCDIHSKALTMCSHLPSPPFALSPQF